MTKKCMRAACWDEMLETPGAFEKGSRSDKEAENELPSATCDSDLKHVSPYYQQGAWTSA